MGNYAKSATLVILGGIAVYFQLNPVKKATKNSKEEESVAETSLVKLAFLFRHGERSPLNTRYNDPYPLEDPKFWPDGKGALTKIGKKNAYLLGKRLRKRYNTILTPHYSKENFTALSTKVDRTMMSAYLVLAGLYPPVDHQKWSDEIPWMPIPVYHNTVFTPTNCYACPRVKYEAVKLFQAQSPERLAPLVKFLEEKTDYKLKRPEHPMVELFALSDSLILQKRQGYKVVDWADEYLELSKGVLHEMFVNITTKTETLQNLTSSLLVDYLLRFMEDSPRISMFSAHDLTLYMLAAALGFDLGETPLPTACIMIEFHQVEGKDLVKAFYIKHTAGEMIPIEMSCGSTCSLDSFKKMLLRLKPADYDALCRQLPEDADSYVNPVLEKIIDSLAATGV